jgi:transposase-like protein
MKVNRSVREKKAIVAEANSMPNNLKPTARKYNIEPYLIRRWKKQII